MILTLLNLSLTVSKLFLALAMAAAGYRLIAGPRAQDRVAAMDAFYVNGLLLLIVFGISTANAFYFEIALAIGLLGFVSTVALGKFLLRGEVIE